MRCAYSDGGEKDRSGRAQIQVPEAMPRIRRTFSHASHRVGHLRPEKENSGTHWTHRPITVLLRTALRGTSGNLNPSAANASSVRQDHRGDWPRRASISGRRDWFALHDERGARQAACAGPDPTMWWGGWCSTSTCALVIGGTQQRRY